MKDRRAPLILVVDVADASRLVLSDVLRRSGFDVEQASTGAEALSHISARPDLIVLVANLPDLSALDVCHRVRANAETTNIPIVHVLPRDPQPDDRMIGLKGGLDAYLARPFQAQELVTI